MSGTALALGNRYRWPAPFRSYEVKLLNCTNTCMLIQRTPRESGLSDKLPLISIVAATPPVSADSADGSSNRFASAATRANQRKR